MTSARLFSFQPELEGWQIIIFTMTAAFS